MYKLTLYLLLLSVFLISSNACVHSSFKGKKDKVESKKTTDFNALEKFIIDPVDPYFSGTQDITMDKPASVITRTILEDKSGILWFTTWDGLISYDGEVYTNHTNKAGLYRYRFFSSLEDREGKLWFGTIGAGVYVYNGKSFINLNKKNGLIGNKVTCLYEDKQGRIWMGTLSGISIYDGKSFINYDKDDGLIGNEVNSITEDSNGEIWIGCVEGISIYNNQNQSFRAFNKSDGTSYSNVRTIIKDKTGSIWFGGNDGLMLYKDGKVRNLMKSFVGYLYEDDLRNLWISAKSEIDDNMGLYFLSGSLYPLPIEDQEPIELYNESGGLIFGITKDNGENIWFGKLDGVCKYDGIEFDCFDE